MAMRYVRSLVWVIAIVLALPVAVLGWLLTSQSGLNWTIARLSAATDGRLVVEGARRTGIASLVAARLRYADPAITVDVRDAVIDVQFAPLLRGRVVVQALSARQIAIETAKSRDDEPLAEPQSLELPLPVEVQALRVASIEYGPPAEAVVFADLDATWSYDGERHAMSLRTLNTPWAAVRGRIEVGAARPFPIDGSLAVRPAFASLGTTYVAVAGELRAMGVGVVARAYEAGVRAKVSVMPFGVSVLAHVDAHVDGFDPRSLDASLPHARLDATADAQIGRDGAIAGAMNVVNRNPGLPARQRLPVVRLQGRFAGDGRNWSLSDIALDAGRAGRLSGAARLTADTVDARLVVHALNLVGLHEAMHATALTGPVRVIRSNGKVDFDADLREAATQISLEGSHAGDRIDLSQVRWRSPAGRIEAKGAVRLSGRIDFEASGRLAGFDPARVGAFPPANLNARFMAKGQARPLLAAVDITIAESQFREQPLTGTVRAGIRPDRIKDALLDVRLGRARVQAKGSLGQPGDRLSFDAEVPNARLIDPQARGSVRLAGTAIGTFREPAIELDVNAADVRYGDRFGVAQLSGRTALEKGGSGRVDIDLNARSVRLGDANLARAEVALQGTRSRHEVRVSAQASDHRLVASLSGGLDDRIAWEGSLQMLQVDGAMSARLVEPVEVRLSSRTARLGKARIEVAKTGRIDLAYLDWDAQGSMKSQGTLSRLPLVALQPLLSIPAAIRSLVVAGQWDVSLAETLAGSLSLRPESGDVAIPGSPPIPARLRTLRVEANVQGSEVRLDARVESETFGRATASASTRAERRAGRWGIAGDAPIRAQVHADMPSLDWSRPLLDAGVSVAGRADMSLSASGTLSVPVFEGHLRAQGLSVSVPDLGLTLRDGVLNARFDGERLALESLRFVSGDGQIVGTGAARLVPGDLSAQVALTAQKLTVLARPDRLAIVSGKVDVAWNPSRLSAKGRFTADRGIVELPRADTPRPSSDVIVLGAKPKAVREFNVEADLALDLGQNFSLRGKGLDTRLAGTLRAQLHPKGGINLSGTVRAVDGTYSAFGRELSIRRGALTFSGPVENPSLDILAVRVVSDVEVGVAVGGTVLVPQIRLVSTPAMSDADRLAWLTLGHGLDHAGKNEAAVLQAAALALLSRGSTDSKGTLASRFGLDTLSLGTTSATGERIVSIGKRFASNFYLGFERGLTGAVSVIRITYDLSRRWSVQARAGSENAVDLFYTLGFR